MARVFMSTLLHCLCCHVISLGAEYINLGMNYRRTVEQSSNYTRGSPYGPENAVDGYTYQTAANGSCIHTLDVSEEWWRIQFRGRVYIQEIIIYHRNDNANVLNRFLHSRVYISDVGGCDGHLVYTQETHPSWPDTSIFNIPVNLDGMYVSICNNNFMQLCEVQIMGCPYNTYGKQCGLTCGNCHDSMCDLATGNCPRDCEERYMGAMCNISCDGQCKDSVCTKTGCTGCIVGKHGAYCDLDCHRNCKNSICSQANGYCSEGCNPGFWDNRCTSMCSRNCTNGICSQTNGFCSEGCTPGNWGNLCSRMCPRNCTNSICSQANGYCSKGCNPGFWDNRCTSMCSRNCTNGICSQANGYCSEGCNPGYWGDQCASKCPRNCTNGVCSQANGYCSEGCNPGYWGDQCTSLCPRNCTNGVCSQTNGYCSEGCNTGYWGDQCTRMCPRNCTNSVCLQANGYCSKGCNPGYWGDLCSGMCPENCLNGVCLQGTGLCDCRPGFWGMYCEYMCPYNCFQSACAKSSGMCNECIAGFLGQNCTDRCETGNFGLSCTETCGHCNGGDENCFHTNGSCIEGCTKQFSGDTCHTETSSLSENGEVTVIASSVAAVLVIVVILAVVVILVKRRRNLQPKHTATRAFQKLNTFTPAEETGKPPGTGKNTSLSINVKGRSNDGAPIGDSSTYMNVDTSDEEENKYYNIPGTSREILLDNLKAYIKSHSADGFSDLFSKMVYGSQFPHEAGESKKNIPNNRFISIFPYDHSRVKIREFATDADYINANYIDSLESKKAYIAAQGPKSNTIEDTWKMILQEKSGKIVMLTNLLEDKKKKCERYWPLAGEKIEFPNMTLTLLSEEVRPFYAIRNIIVSVEQAGETQEMHVKQFHFTSWPDHGVADPRQLVVFHRRVVQAKTSLPGPLIVHCSAGVGRTGTFIGLDAMVTYGRMKKRVDIKGYVDKMRKSRMNMVQTAEQFQLLHEAVYEALMYPQSSIFRKDFLRRYDQIRNRLSEEYQVLQAMLPEYSPENYSEATLEANSDKNRNRSILPPNKYRPILSTFVSGTTNYINAVTVAGCVQNSRFLVTQLPLPNTVVDFWRMVRDHDSNTIVLLNSADEKQKSPLVLPSRDKAMKIGPLDIKLVSTETVQDNIIESVLHITQKNSQRKQEVMVLRATSWKISEALPPSTKLVLDLVDTVHRWQQKKGLQPITVQCFDGATCSGLYCTVSKIIQQIKIDQEVDVFQAVREIQICRPQFIQSQTQYRFCYEIAREFLRLAESDVYGNIDTVA